LLLQLATPIKIKKSQKNGQKVVKKLSGSYQKIVKNFVPTNKSQNKVNCPEKNWKKKKKKSMSKKKKKIIGIP
jgi:hypothetical protein